MSLFSIDDLNVFASYLIANVMKGDESQLIKEVLTGAGKDMYDAMKTRGRELWLSDSKGVIRKFNQAANTNQMVPGIKNAFRKGNMNGSESKMFNYAKLGELYTKMAESDRNSMINYVDDISTRGSIKMIDVPQLDVFEGMGFDPLEQAIGQMSPDERKRLNEQISEVLNDDIIEDRLKESVVMDDGMETIPLLADHEIEELLQEIEGRPEIKHSRGLPKLIQTQPPVDDARPIDPEPIDSRTIPRDPRLDIDLESGKMPDQPPSIDEVPLPGERVIPEPEGQAGFLSNLYHDISTGVFRQVTSDLVRQLPKMLLASGNNVLRLQNEAKQYVTDRATALGITSKVALNILLPLVTNFVYSWFYNQTEEPAEPPVEPIIEEPSKVDVKFDKEDIDDPVIPDKPDGKIISSEIITDKTKQQKPPKGVSTEPLVINVVPDPKIIQDTKKTEVFDPETQGNVLFASEELNNKKDDFKVSREALFSYRRDVLGTAKTNPFVARQQQQDLIRYSNMSTPTPNVFQPLPPNDINQFNQIWGDTPAMISQGMPRFPPLAPTVDELEKKYFGQKPTDIGGVVKPDFKTHETMMFAPNGGLNDFTQGFGNPMRDFQETQVLDPSKEMLFGQTKAFL